MSQRKNSTVSRKNAAPRDQIQRKILAPSRPVRLGSLKGTC